MTLDQLLAIQNALETAEQRLLATHKDRPIEPIKNLLDQITEAQEIVKSEILSNSENIAG